MSVYTEQIESETKTPQTLVMRSLPWVITLVAGLICYGLFYNRSVWLSVIGYSISPAERVLQGEVPYRDFLYNYTPGILWLNAFLMKILGTNLLTVHLGLFAFKLATLLVLYLVARKLVGQWFGLIPVALTLSWIGYKYIFGVFPTQYSMLFVLFGIYSMLRFDEREKTIWLLACGLSVGAVFLFKYNVGILLFGAATLIVFIKQLTISNKSLGQRLIHTFKIAAIFWLGFAMALAPLIYYLVKHQALQAMINHFLHHASAYSGERAVALPGLKWLIPVIAGLMVVSGVGVVVARKTLKYFNAFVGMVVLVAGAVLFYPNRAFIIKNSAMATVAYLPLFLFFAIAIGLLISYWFLIRNSLSTGKAKSLTNKREWWTYNRQVIIVGLFALGAYLEIYPRADYYHVIRALPPTFLLMTLLLVKAVPILQEMFSAQSPLLKPAIYRVIGAVVMLFGFVGVQNSWLPNFDAKFRFIDRAAVNIERAQGILVPPKQAEFIEQLTQAIQSNSSPDDYIFSFGQRGAGFYFLAGRPNPTKFVWWRNVGISKADREAVIQMLNEKRAKLILLQDSLKDARVREAVAANYHQVGWVSGIAIYDRNT
ncbi:MAG: glycosyltransferase family 39 protein [Acidobacteriota bacterium]